MRSRGQIELPGVGPTARIDQIPIPGTALGRVPNPVGTSIHGYVERVVITGGRHDPAPYPVGAADIDVERILNRAGAGRRALYIAVALRHPEKGLLRSIGIAVYLHGQIDIAIFGFKPNFAVCFLLVGDQWVGAGGQFVTIVDTIAIAVGLGGVGMINRSFIRV